MRKHYFFQSKNDILKFIYLILEFIFVFCLLILPPMLVSKNQNEVSYQFSLYNVIFCSVTGIALYFIVFFIPFSSDFLKKEQAFTKYSLSFFFVTFIFIFILNLFEAD
ncbi:MAG: hypothetical protein K6G52_01965 [Treponemataceae bacterium]|nr:hypothetical protein [Treponemataceae bacterium]